MFLGMTNNVEQMRHRLDVLMHLYPWVQMVVFSELAAHGPAPHSAQPAGGGFEKEFKEMARRHGIWLVPGSIFEKRDGAIYNMTPVVSPEGEIVARYRKMFPFAPYEPATSPGDEFCVFEVPGVGRFGLAICYDIWFPETTRTLTSAGVEVLIHPVLTGTTDRQAELAIVQATAVMFSCYVFDVNGLDGGGVGRSLVVDPTGVVLHQCGQATEIFPINIDLGLFRQVRAEGANGLGQVLKSFRDKNVVLSTYADNGSSAYLDSLGPLVPMRKRDWS